MNERIKEIGSQVGFVFLDDGVYGRRWYESKCGMDKVEIEKFAELIIREVFAKIDDERFEVYQPVKESVMQHFGVDW